MRTEKIKQIICISELSAETFEDKMNEALSGLVDPEIRFDTNKSFTAVIVYKVKRNMPEDVLELFEIIEGKNQRCCDCPYYVPPTDKRKKWGTCSATGERTRPEGRACEQFYLLRYKALTEAAEKYKELPFVLE